MDSKSMMELTKELDAEFDNLVNNCMTSGAIDLNLYPYIISPFLTTYMLFSLFPSSSHPTKRFPESNTS